MKYSKAIFPIIAAYWANIAINFLGAAYCEKYFDAKYLDAKLSSLKNRAEICSIYAPKSQTENLQRCLTDLTLPRFGYVSPFWSYLRVGSAIPKAEEKLDNILTSIDSVAQKSAMRRITLGLALNGVDSSVLETAVKLANNTLTKNSIYANIGETVRVAMPLKAKGKEMQYGIKNSFSRPMDYYFIWTDADYADSTGDIAIISHPSLRLSVFDKDIKSKDLPKIIAQEIARLFGNREDHAFSSHDLAEYLAPIPSGQIKANLKIPLANKPSDASKNYAKIRDVKVCVGLDGYSNEDAKKWFSEINSRYMSHFNISFVPVMYLDCGKIKNIYYHMRESSSKYAPDIGILFTNNVLKKIGGLASEDLGLAAIVADNDTDIVDIAEHEIAHLFGVNHVYKIGNIMLPNYQRGHNNWTDMTKNEILQNKFRKWEFTPSYSTK